MVVVSIGILEWARLGVEISRQLEGQTPVTTYQLHAADGPVVVVAHGFAGSQQMMQGYALPLALAGYRVHVFEFLGHGRHSTPMSGDVTTIDGTTRLLVNQTNAVIDAVAEPDTPVALLGHSMATDVLVRTAQTRDDIGPIVLISAFSQAIDGTSPVNLVLITGAWEPGLRAVGLEAARMVVANATEGETVVAGRVVRRAAVAPFSEHVSVLHSRVGRREALAWLNRAYARTSNVTIHPTGWALLGMLAGIVIFFHNVVAPRVESRLAPVAMSDRQFALVVSLPAIAAPLLAAKLQMSVLPVLVADYLGLHMLLFGVIQIGLLYRSGARFGAFDWRGFVPLMVTCLLFGFLLNRYAANFWPTPQRVGIIAVLLVGALPFMLADAMLSAAVTLWRRIAVRIGFLVSLGIAVTLDFEGLFFLVMIAPVMVLFYAVFGTMGRSAAKVSGPLAPGVVLGLVLAWVLGVSFPLFQA